MTPTLTCSIPGHTERYDIAIGNGSLAGQASYLSKLAARIAIISDDVVAPLYGQQLCDELCKAGLEAYLFSFPHGEQHKSRDTKERLEDQLFDKGLGRDTCLIALGGGVVTDLGGYIAATYCRGIPLVMAPTSLLGMVDASIGGKTGVNVPYGKNLLGCIYQPSKVIIDPSTLNSLPTQELTNGVVEMIKHGVIADATYFDELYNHCDELKALEAGIVEKAIYDSCRIKKNIVEEDERENGRRRLLNFGHTVGHALEKVSHYTLSHGEAVAIGMLVEGYVSVQLGILSEASLDRIRVLLQRYGVPLSLPPKLDVQMLYDAMALDKKSLKGLPRFVIINEIGSALPYDGAYCTPIDEKLLKQALQQILR